MTASSRSISDMRFRLKGTATSSIRLQPPQFTTPEQLCRISVSWGIVLWCIVMSCNLFERDTGGLLTQGQLKASPRHQ
jgi:hypothetical protein